MSSEISIATLPAIKEEYLAITIAYALWDYFMPIVFVFGCIGNIMILYVSLTVIKTKNKHLALFLVLLAAIDILILINPYILYHWSLKRRSYSQTLIIHYHIILCKFLSGFTFTALRWENIILTGLSIERLLVVVFNKSSISYIKIIVFMSTAFVLNFLFDLPNYIALTIDRRGWCVYEWGNYAWISKIWRLTDNVLGFVFLIVLAFINSAVISKILRYYYMRKKMTSSTEAINMKPPSSTTILLVANVVMYMFCSLPAKVYYQSLGQSIPRHVIYKSQNYYNYRLLWTCLLILQCLNFVVNFYLNIIVSKGFQKDTKKSLLCFYKNRYKKTMPLFRTIKQFRKCVCKIKYYYNWLNWRGLHMATVKSLYVLFVYNMYLVISVEWYYLKECLFP